MGLLIVEMVAAYGVTLREMVNQLLADVGPAFYERTDLRLKRPVSKTIMTERLINEPPSGIGGQSVAEVATIDGVKYIMADDSWLLIRPSGTEPVLRVYAEGRTPEMVRALLGFGESVAASLT
jgi:phosphomannomutase